MVEPAVGAGSALASGVEQVAITTPPTVEEWGERAFQVRDPNGVIAQLVDWNGHAAG